MLTCFLSMLSTFALNISLLPNKWRPFSAFAKAVEPYDSFFTTQESAFTRTRQESAFKRTPFFSPNSYELAPEGILTLHRYLHTQSNWLSGILTLNQNPHQLQAVKVETFVNKKSAICSQRRIGRCPHAKIVKCAHQLKVQRPSPFQKKESRKALQQRSTRRTVIDLITSW